MRALVIAALSIVLGAAVAILVVVHVLDDLFEAGVKTVGG